MTFGIIGYGSFGKLAAEVLSAFGEVKVYSRSQKQSSERKFVSFEEAAEAKIVILAVGLEVLDDVSAKLSYLVKEDTLVVDVCSVKVKPVEILNNNLGGKCRILATHPLFGPHTIENSSITGKSIVICSNQTKNKDKIINFLKNELRLNVIEMSAEEHDREMAWVHGLTFFVGRGLTRLNPPKSQLATGYYQKLLDLVELESTHSIELFNTVQKGNPFAREVREKLLNELNIINTEIEEEEHGRN